MAYLVLGYFSGDPEGIPSEAVNDPMNNGSQWGGESSDP